jgi:membrane protein YdbS with pleckstrin-like domain
MAIEVNRRYQTDLQVAQSPCQNSFGGSGGSPNRHPDYAEPADRRSRGNPARLVLRRTSGRTLSMPEQTIWRGTSSQWKNSGAFIVWGIASVVIICLSIVLCRAANPTMARFGPLLLLLLLVPVAIIATRILQARSKMFELTNERLKISQGVFSKMTDTLELYRVKDIEIRQPFWYRIGGVENVQLNTSDSSSPLVVLDAIPCSMSLGDQIRNQVEVIRQQKGVREIDME